MGRLGAWNAAGAVVAAVALAGCGTTPPSQELGEAQQAAETPLLRAALTGKWSSAAVAEDSSAHYAVCAGQPFLMAFMFKNLGKAVWRDVKPGSGDTAGSDVYLISRTGAPDELTGIRKMTIRTNKNDFVRGDRKAKNCSNERGCRRTVFRRDAMPAVAPDKPGTIIGSKWRLRDFSDKWGNKSKAFGPRVNLNFLVEDCGSTQPSGCKCQIQCWNGDVFDVSAGCQPNGAPNCADIKNDPCPPKPLDGGAGGFGGAAGAGGAAGGGGSPGGGGSGGTSSGGGGSPGGGGSSSGGSGGSGGSSAGSIQCGTNTCYLPVIWQGKATLCCTGSNSCGYKSEYSLGKCLGMEPPDDLEGGLPPDPDEEDLDPPDDDPDYQDPPIPDDEGSDDWDGTYGSQGYSGYGGGPPRGGVISDDGGCSVATRRAGSGGLLLFLGLLLGASRRRRR